MAAIAVKTTVAPQGTEEQLLQAIRERAFALWAQQGYSHGRHVDHWLKAERECCWPAAELDDKPDQFRLVVTLPGYNAGEVDVSAEPRAITIHANTKQRRKKDGWNECWSEFGSNNVYRRFELPQAIDVKRVKATLDKGILEINAGKATGESKAPIPVAAA